MNGEPHDPPQAANPHPLPTEPELPVSGALPPLIATCPPPLPPQPALRSWPSRQMLATLLSLGLGVFLADAIVSLADDTLILLFGAHLLSGIRGIVFLFDILMAVVI